MKSIQNRLSAIPPVIDWPWYITLPVSFLIFHLGTRVSVYFIVERGISLWYLPIPLALILIHLWGPGVLLPLYLNAAISAGLWGLAKWPFWPVYALPETGQVLLAWFLFTRFYKGIPWLPDFKNQQGFLIWGIFLPSLFGNLWLNAEFLLLGDIALTNIAQSFLTSWVADLLGNLVVAVPVLYFCAPLMQKNRFSLAGSVQRIRFWGNRARSDWLKAVLLFGSITLVSLWLPPQDYWFVYGILILGVAFQAGLTLMFAINFWIICCVLLFPPFFPNLYSWHWIAEENLSRVYLSLICLCTAGISVARVLKELHANMAHLAESESRFRLLAENSTDMISRHDLQGNYLYASPSSRILLGYEPEELIGHSAFDFIHPDDIRITNRVRSTIIERPMDYTTLTRVRRKNGDYIWLETTGHTIFDPKTRTPLEIHAASRDVTKRKQAEDLLRESELRFRNLFENAPVGIFHSTITGKIIDVNEDYSRMMGYASPAEAKDIVNHTSIADSVWVQPEERARLIETVTANPGHWLKTEQSFRRRDGDHRIANLIIRTLPENPEYLEGFLEDITERKLAEDALRHSEARFRALVENAPDAIVVFDAKNSVFTDCNENACRLFRLGRDEMLTKTPVDLSPPFQPDGKPSAESAQEKIQQVIVGKSPHFEWMHRNASGDDIPCEVNLTILPSSEGVFIRGSIVNISERKQAEEQARLLQSILISVSTVDDLSSTLEVVLRQVCEKTGWVFGQAWLPRRDQSVLEANVAWFSDARLEMFKVSSMQTLFAPGQGLLGRVWSSKQPVWLENAPLDPHFPRADVAAKLGLKAALAMPILANGDVVAVIEFFLREQRAEDERLVSLIGAVAAQMGLVMERKRAEEELRRAEELFRAVVEDQTEMIVRWKPDGTRTFVNQAYCRTFGRPYEEIVGTNFWPFVPEPFRQRRLDWIRSLKPDAPYSTSVHVSLLPDGGTQWQEWADHGFFDEQGNLIELQSVGRDITDRRRIEQEERLQAARRETLAEISQALANVGLDTQAVFETIARYTAEHIGEICVIRLLDPDEQVLNLVAFHHPVPEMETFLKPAYQFPMPVSHKWFSEILQTGKSLLIPVVIEPQVNVLIPTELHSITQQFRTHSALIAPLRMDGEVIGAIALTRVDPDSPSYTSNDQVLLQELADRAGLTIQNARLFEQVKGARERLEALSHRLLEVQEAERRALTGELHDRVGQNLTGLSINLQNMRALLPGETVKMLVGMFDDAQLLVQDTTRQIRDIMAELHLPELEDYGLAVALETYAERVARRAHLELVTDLPDFSTPQLSSPVRIALFRAAQEAINNVLKHAKATQLEISLKLDESRVRLRVADNGKGFQPAATSPKAAQSWGLSIMRERIESIGGNVQIESSPGAGTQVIFEVGRP